MRHLKRFQHRTNTFFAACSLGILAFILLAMVPAPAFAQSATCNSNLQVVFEGPLSPWFTGDVLTAKALFDNQVSANSDYMDIPDFGYAMDCKALADMDVPPPPGEGVTYANCEPKGHTVEFLGAVQVNSGCVNPGGNPIQFPAPQSSFIDFIPLNGPLRVAEVQNCLVEWQFKIVETVPGDSEVRQVVTFPIDEINNPAECENGIPTGQSREAVFTVHTCSVEVKKQISTDGLDWDDPAATNWFDADEQIDALDLGASGLAFYRVIVTNNGTAAFTGPVEISDPGLGIDTQTVATLAPGESEILGGVYAGVSNNWSDQCEDSSDLSNTIQATAQCRDSDDDAEDVFSIESNDAWGSCDNFEVNEPDISLKKQVSLSSAGPWSDADNSGSALETTFPDAAWYRLVVENIGNEQLTDVEVSDPTLGFALEPVDDGTLDPGEEVILDATDIALLAVDPVCTSRTTVNNVASVEGVPAISGGTVSDTDPAFVSCVGVPDISIEKQISLTGADGTWEDVEVSAIDPANAFYRIIVTNSGTEKLANVEVEDNDLNPPFSAFIGDLEVGEIRVFQAPGLDQLDPPATTTEDANLAVSEPCPTPGDRMNTAFVNGENFFDEADTVADSDPANLDCQGAPGLEVTKEVRKLPDGPWLDADTENLGLATPLPVDVEYRITVENTGSVDLTDVVVTDGTLGINQLVGSLLVGETKVLKTTCEIGELDCIAVAALTWLDRCESAGSFVNTATATGGDESDSDAAWVVCTGTGAIRVIKEIGVCEADDDGSSDDDSSSDDGDDDSSSGEGDDDSSSGEGDDDSSSGEGDDGAAECTIQNGGDDDSSSDDDSSGGGDDDSSSGAGVIVWYDDETPPQFPPADAWYRITVSNIGNENLTNVELDDFVLGIDYTIGDLAIGEEVVIDEGVLAQLFVPNACTVAGEVVNIAEVTGEPPLGPNVDDSDFATLVCGASEQDLCDYLFTSLYVIYDGDSDTSHSQGKKAYVDPDDAVFPPGPVDIQVFDEDGKLITTQLGVEPGDEFLLSGMLFKNADAVVFRIYAAGEIPDDDDSSGCGDDDSDESINWLTSGQAGKKSSFTLDDDDSSEGSCVEPIQTVRFAVDCDVPLFIGDEFGAITISD